MKNIILAMAIILVATSSAFAIQCPVGSFPWQDNWGNKICKRFGNGGTANIQGSLAKCPTGTFRWADKW